MKTIREFDAFQGMSDKDIAGAIRKADPLYTGLNDSDVMKLAGKFPADVLLEGGIDSLVRQASDKPTGYFGDLANSFQRGIDTFNQAYDVAEYQLGIDNPAKTAESLHQNQLEKEMNPMSPEMAAKLKEIEDIEGLGETAFELLMNPSLLPIIAAESFANMAPSVAGGAAGAVAGSMVAPGVGTLTGAIAGTGAGTFAAEYSNTILDALAKKGARTPQDIEKLLNDEAFMADAAQDGVERGIPIAAMDMLSMGLAGKLYKGVRGGFQKSGATSKVGTAAGVGLGLTAEAGMQAGLGSAGEALAILNDKGEITKDDDFNIVVEGLAELPMSAVDVGVKGFGLGVDKLKEPKATQGITDMPDGVDIMSERQEEAQRTQAVDDEIAQLEAQGQPPEEPTQFTNRMQALHEQTRPQGGYMPTPDDIRDYEIGRFNQLDERIAQRKFEQSPEYQLAEQWATTKPSSPAALSWKLQGIREDQRNANADKFGLPAPQENGQDLARPAITNQGLNTADKQPAAGANYYNQQQEQYAFDEEPANPSLPKQAAQLPKVPENFQDYRLQNPAYRGALEVMANELERNSGGEMVPDMSYQMGESDGGQRPMKRLESRNPKWFQEFAYENRNENDSKVSVEQFQNAVGKALRGEKLLESEQRLVKGALDINDSDVQADIAFETQVGQVDFEQQEQDRQAQLDRETVEEYFAQPPVSGRGEVFTPTFEQVDNAVEKSESSKYMSKSERSIIANLDVPKWKAAQEQGVFAQQSDYGQAKQNLPAGNIPTENQEVQDAKTQPTIKATQEAEIEAEEVNTTQKPVEDVQENAKVEQGISYSNIDATEAMFSYVDKLPPMRKASVVKALSVKRDDVSRADFIKSKVDDGYSVDNNSLVKNSESISVTATEADFAKSLSSGLPVTEKAISEAKSFKQAESIVKKYNGKVNQFETLDAQVDTVLKNNNLKIDESQSSTLESKLKLIEQTLESSVRISSSGKPFKSEKTARLSKTFKSLTNAEVVPVDGGFGVRESKPDQEILNDDKMDSSVTDAVTNKQGAAETVTESKPNQETQPAGQETSEQNQATESNQPIEDVGEKLGGARKDEVLSVKVRENMTDDDFIASNPLSKIWPTKEIDQIEDKSLAAFSYITRSEIPSKPRKSYKLNRWVAQVKKARESMDVFAENTEQFLNIARAGSLDMKSVVAKYELLMSIDRADWKRIGKVYDYSTAFTYENSEKVSKPSMAVEVDGRMVRKEGAMNATDIMPEVRSALLSSEATPKKMQFEIRKNRYTGKRFINKKGDKEYSPLKTFDSFDDALNFKNNNYDELVALWDGVKERKNVKKADVRGKENAPRIGKDHRNGRDIEPQEFIDTFGFRGAEFGNWVKQGKNDKERQGLINSAYDAFMDLAAIINVPPKAISLDGSLGIGFGSRGRGQYSAHFEPGSIVINLTKTRGAGSLAHEWFHALDNYFSRYRDGRILEKRSGTSFNFADSKHSYITYQPEPLLVHKDGALSNMTLAQLEYYQKTRKAKVYNSENWMQDPEHPAGVRPEVEAKFAQLVTALDASNMKKRSVEVDGGKTGYWSRIIERAARSFENYVITKLKDSGNENQFLANVMPIENFPRESSRYPYLLEEEMAPVSEAFDDLFKTIETKETDDGNVALFSRKVENNTLSTASATGRLSVDAIQTRVDAINRGLASVKSQASVFVYDDIAAMPERIQQEINAQNAANDFAGVYTDSDKLVHIYAPNIESETHLEEVILHELEGHFGIRKLFGDDVGKKLNQIYTLLGGEKGMKRWLDKNGIKMADSYFQEAAKRREQYGKVKGDMFLADEFLAHIQGSRAKETLPAGIKRRWNELKSMIAKKLRDFGFESLSERVESNDTLIYGTLRQARQAVKQNKEAGEMGGALFSMLEKDNGKGSPAWEAAKAKGLDMSYEARMQRARDMGFDTDTVYYHGTNEEFVSFSKSKVRSSTGAALFGDGFYFTDRENIASGYGENIKKVYLRTENPYIIDDNSVEDDLNSLSDEDAFKKELVTRGYDSVIIDQSGEKEVVVFEPDQIRSINAAFDPDQADSPNILFSRKEPLAQQSVKDISDMVAKSATPSFLGKIYESKNKARELSLRLFTNNQLAEMFKGVFDRFERNPLEAFQRRMQDMEGDLSSQMRASERLRQQWDKLGKEESQKVSDLMSESTFFRVDLSKEFNYQEQKEAIGKKLNALAKKVKAKESQIAGRTGETKLMAELVELREKQTQARNDYRALADQQVQLPRMRKAFDSLSPEAKQLYKDVRDAYAKQFQTQVDELINRISRNIADERKRKELVDQVQERFKMLSQRGVYFPLQRFGDYHVIAKQFDDDGNVTDYIRLHYENEAQAMTAVKELEADGYEATFKKKIDQDDFANESLSQFAQDLTETLDKKKNTLVTGESIRDDIYQLMLQRMPEVSSLKRSIHRKYVKGFSADQKRAFAFNMFHGAYRIAKIRHGDVMRTHLKEIEDGMEQGLVSKKDISKTTDLLNEMLWRYQDSMNPQGAQWSARATQFGFMYFLGASPFTAVLNMTQPALFTAPYLGAKYGNAKATAAMLRASKDYFGSGFKLSMFESAVSLERSKKLSTGEKAMITELVEAGVIETTQAHSLAQLSETNTVNSSNKMDKFNRMIGYFYHNAEVFNREVTALAAYRLAKGKGASHGSAVDAARKTIFDTHFDYSYHNRARFMRSNPAKVLLLFKNYAQQATYLIVKAAYDAAKGDKEQLKFILNSTLSHLLIAGAAGLPVFGLVMAVVGIGMDDYELPEQEFKKMLRDIAQALGSDDPGFWAELFTKGVFNAAGLDVSSRSSADLAEMWVRSDDVGDRTPARDLAIALTGPLGGLVFKGMDSALFNLDNGDTAKGAGFFIPVKGLRDAWKAGDMYMNGIYTRNGDDILSSGEVDFWDAFAKASGVTPSEVSRRYERVRDVRKILSKIKGKADKLKSKLYRTYREIGMVDDKVLSEIHLFNAEHPRFRIDVRASLESRIRGAGQSDGRGMRINKRNEEIVGDYEMYSDR